MDWDKAKPRSFAPSLKPGTRKKQDQRATATAAANSGNESSTESPAHPLASVCCRLRPSASPP